MFAQPLRRAATVAAAVLALVGLWELYRWIWTSAGWTWPFVVDKTSMPHVWTIFRAFGQPTQVNQPALITILFHKSVFTGTAALVGCAVAAIVGFAIGIVLAHSRLLQRGFLPYIVASQTIPILAIAPMVVVWVNPKLPSSLQGWGAVAVIASYLTFFPVLINTLRGLQSADARALELMRTYAASRWSVLWKLRVPASLPYVFAALKLAATASVVGAIIGQPPSGTVTVNGKPARKARADGDYGIVFQDSVLFDWRTDAKNIALPLEMLGWSKERRKTRVEEMLDLVELKSFGDHHPWQLSGGMQQRASIARALAFEPALLLMDEPFGALDEMTRERLNLELLSIWDRLRSTIVFVTHSISEAVFLSSRVVVMSPRPGRIAGIVDIDLADHRDVETREDPHFFELVTEVRE